MSTTHNSTQAVNPLHSLLQVYALYRLAVVCILWVLFFLKTGVGDEVPNLFYAAGLSYLIINITLLFQAWKNWLPSFKALLFIVMTDVVLLQLITRASGPYDSGISILMLIAIAAGSMFITKHSLLLPALATITVLLFSSIDYLNGSATTSQLVASGWLSLAFFLVNISINYLTTRLRSSEQHAATEAALAKKLSHLNSLIIERMQTGVVIVNSNSTVLSCNSSARQLLELDDSKIAGLNQSNTLEQLNKDLATFFIQWQQTSVLTHDEKINPAVTSTPVEISESGTMLQLTPIRISDTDESEFLIFIEDMAKIAQQAQHLKLSSLGKLTASIAHEIRNPIGAVSHAAQLLQLNAQTDEDQKLTNIIYQQSKRCANIIESVMNVSRGSASNIEQFDLAKWLPNFLSNYALAQQGKIDVNAPTSLIIRFDKSQLDQIISNLLDNGIRAGLSNTKEPEIKIHARLDHNHKPVLDIIDQGNGVDNEGQSRLFEPFFTTEKTGSGLGLYICRELCRANQATITYAKTEQLHPNFSSHCFRIHFSHPDRQPIQLQEITSV